MSADVKIQANPDFHMEGWSNTPQPPRSGIELAWSQRENPPVLEGTAGTVRYSLMFLKCT